MERQRSRRHLVQHCPKREQIGSGVEFLAFGLLGRHVCHCAEGCARTSEMIRIHRSRLSVKRPNVAGRTGCDHDFC